MANKLTQKIAREYVRILGGRLKRNPEYNEFVVKFGENEYFTDNLDDVLATAAAMQGSNEDFERAEQYLSDCLGSRS